MPRATPPLEGDALFAQLSGRDGPRPGFDRELVASLRAHLELAAAPALGLADDVVVRVSKASSERVRRCEAMHVALLGVGAPQSVPLVRGRLLDAVFRRVVTTGEVGPDAFDEAVAACRADGDESIDEALAAFSGPDRDEVRSDVGERATALAARWPRMPASANVRTQERSVVRLAQGRVVLTSRPDVTFGRVMSRGSRVCLVEAKSGILRPSHHADLRFYALVEALRWGAPPLRASTYAMADGRVACLTPDADELTAAAETASDAIRRLVRLASGGEARRDASSLCPSCPLVDGCPEGRRQRALAHGAAWQDGDEMWAGDLDMEDEVA